MLGSEEYYHQLVVFGAPLAKATNRACRFNSLPSASKVLLVRSGEVSGPLVIFMLFVLVCGKDSVTRVVQGFLAKTIQAAYGRNRTATYASIRLALNFELFTRATA